MSPALQRPLRYAAIVGLVVVLFLLGMNSGPVYQFLTDVWAAVLPTALADSLRQGTSTLVTKKSLPAMLTYGIFYTSLCLLLIGLLLGTWRRLGLALTAYWLIFGACALLLLLGKIGHLDWAYQLARRLIDLVVSPLPVIILVPLLHWQRRLAVSE